MPSIRDFHNISPLTRVAMLDQFGEAVYGTPLYKAKLSRDLGISPTTIQKWVRERKVPVWALLLLWEWNPQNNRETRLLRQWNSVQKAFSNLAHELETATAIARGGAVVAEPDAPSDDPE